ncbi:lasso peptide biosynthesis B2 protein [Metabacillus litoralis]|uniref:lasso peptide biosynthesis B2 protein n=1 Tax=Metabacillus litoralis TaxID=152268 RepID=UPI00203DDAE2|nr:lasso peptide biosynthesis B2 protein [Metabacillus litoralis]MCM3650406.1 lasso peptide biosynthesis B2 protein [Metabacillus litoralis]
MKLLNRFRAFCSFDFSTKLLFIEAYFLLLNARILKLQPFSKVLVSLGTQSGETNLNNVQLDKKVLRNISNAINIMSKHTFWESMCLVRAIAAMKMLERRNIESTLYLGTAKDESGKLVAHAWLRSGPFYVTGSEGMEKFTVVGKFAKKIQGESNG